MHLLIPRSLDYTEKVNLIDIMLFEKQEEVSKKPSSSKFFKAVTRNLIK